jgi:hypothetical protein
MHGGGVGQRTARRGLTVAPWDHGMCFGVLRFDMAQGGNTGGGGCVREGVDWFLWWNGGVRGDVGVGWGVWGCGWGRGWVCGGEGLEWVCEGVGEWLA